MIPEKSQAAFLDKSNKIDLSKQHPVSDEIRGGKNGERPDLTEPCDAV